MPFTGSELPDGFKPLQALMLRRVGGDREMVDVLALLLHHDEPGDCRKFRVRAGG